MLPPSHVPPLDGPRLTARSSREAWGQCASHGHQPSCAVSPGPGLGGGVEPAGRQAAPGWALLGQVWPRRSGPGSLVPCPPPSPRLSQPPVPLMPRCDRPAQSALFNPDAEIQPPVSLPLRLREGQLRPQVSRAERASHPRACPTQPSGR